MEEIIKEEELEETLENPQEEGSPDTEENQETEDASTSEDEVEKLKKINAQLYARLKKLEAKVKSEPKNSDNKVEKKDDSSWRIERLEFQLKHRDLEQEHIDYLEAYAKSKGVSLEDAFKVDFIKKAIEKDIEEKRLAEAVSGGKSKGENLKSFMDEAREAAKDPEKHKEFWKKVMSQGKGVSFE